MSPVHSKRSVRFSTVHSVAHAPLPSFASDAASDTSDDKAPLLPSPVPRSCSRSRGGRTQRSRRVWTTCGTGLVVALVALAVVFGVIVWENEEGDEESFLLATGEHGAVASDVEQCSQIGVSLLKGGGNAVDAIIGTGLCIGTVNSFSSGIGGGGFMVARLANGTSASYNFRETAPSASHRHMFDHDPELAKVGGLAVGIPGELSGYMTAHSQLGLLPWHALFAPAVAMNRKGFRVSKVLAHAIDESKDLFLEDPETWGWLLNKAGRPLTEGEVLRRPKYADTLAHVGGLDAKVARGHPDEYAGVHDFYHGPFAAQLARTIRAAGGIATAEDFANYTTIVSPVLSTQAFGREVLTCPPPCSGVAMLEALNLAERLPLDDAHAPASHHLLVEGMKWLSAGRTELGDPFDPVVQNNSARIAELVSPAFADAVVKNISLDRTFAWPHYHPSYEPNDEAGTSHISVLDRAGGAAALTTTVNLYFGAKVACPVTGVVLNSEMDDFSIPGHGNAYALQPSIYNYILPGKRPLSSTAPTILVLPSGEVDLVVGASGGSRIVTGVFQAIVKRCVWGFGLLDMIRSGRLHHQLVPQVVLAENEVPGWVLEGLRARGHEVERRTGGDAAFSVMAGVARGEDGGVEGVADWWRKGGRAAGY